MVNIKRRARGVTLTHKGLRKLQIAKGSEEQHELTGKCSKLEGIQEKNLLCEDTIAKIFTCKSPVDKRSLKICFQALDLILESDDYYNPKDETSRGEKFLYSYPELPMGQVPLDSPYYVQRQPLEDRCYGEITKPGGSLKIKGAYLTGKTSLITRLLERSKQQGYHTIYINLSLAESYILQNLERLLRWFCTHISLALNLPDKISEYWDSSSAAEMNCVLYFERYLLPNINVPIVIALDEADRLFDFADVSDLFLHLLGWFHEKAKHNPVWQKLRLVITHAMEQYPPSTLKPSSLSIGLSVNLPPFNLQEVQQLATRYRLELSIYQLEQLMALVGGNPFLVRLAFYEISQGRQTIETILFTSPISHQYIYKEHLEQQLCILEYKYKNLIADWIKVIKSEEPRPLEPTNLHRLKSLGLIQYEGNLATPSCQLYKIYFQECLGLDNTPPSSLSFSIVKVTNKMKVS
ncbi:MAG: hypothetical protein N5P05_003148 [Chroococcopsis gigantea SAG 12.99]|jgi:hypothetical protein|nr:AAA-like domain-containing protein [Chlorogloea purpurea SAG 13.99]MDV3001542.1 hypothetical protein [Chroococcopsis gigantea SAG 12.99]